MVKKSKKALILEDEKLQYLKILQAHYFPIWNKIEKQVDKIKIPLAKIRYLDEQDLLYIENVIKTPELLYSSGSHIANTYPHKIGMDALIENKKKQIVLKYGLKNTLLNRKPKKLITFQWKGNSKTELPELYNRIKGFFDTDENNFIAVFSGVLIGKIKTIQLKKEMSNKLLAYFLFQIEYLHYIEKCNWQNIAGDGKIFMNEKGKILTANDLSVAATLNKREGEPKGHEKIKLILTDIKKP